MTVSAGRSRDAPHPQDRENERDEDDTPERARGHPQGLAKRPLFVSQPGPRLAASAPRGSSSQAMSRQIRTICTATPSRGTQIHHRRAVPAGSRSWSPTLAKGPAPAPDGVETGVAARAPPHWQSPGYSRARMSCWRRDDILPADRFVGWTSSFEPIGVALAVQTRGIGSRRARGVRTTGARLTRSRGARVPTPTPPSTPDSAPLPFGFAGKVTVWDPIHRYLEIGPRSFRVAPGVAVAGLRVGVFIIVTGYVDRPADDGARWIVTDFALG